MMGSILANALVINIFLPIAQVAGFWYFWRDKITSPWWFASIGLVAAYVIMAVCFTSTFSNIGISGNVSGASGDGIDSLTVRYACITSLGIICSAVLLWGLRKFFGK